MHEWIVRNILSGKRPYLIIIVAGFLLYAQTLFFDFSYLDDNTLILDNQVFLSSWENIFASFQTDVFHLFNHSAAYYRPLLTISFLLDYQIGSVGPFIYHLTNVGLHLLVACLVFVFFLQLGYRRDLSFFCASIFLVHPALTQAVAWIPGRNDSLLAVFLLAFFICFLKYLKTSAKKYLIWFFAFFLLALFTKETALFSWPIFFCYLYFIRKEKTPDFKKLNFFATLAGITGIWLIFRHLALQGSMQGSLGEMLISVFSNLTALVQLTGKIFLPFNLTVLPIIQDTTFLYGILSLGLMGALILFTKEKRWNFIFLGLGWFLIFLLPSFMRPNSTLTADFIEHRLYVPLIGLLILFMETEIAKKFSCEKKSSLLLAASILLLFSGLTLSHSHDFTNRLTFWQKAAQDSPHYPLARRNLGAMYYLEKRPDEAEKEFRAALELNPQEEMAHNNLGLIQMERGNYAAAEDEFKKELENNPYYDNGYANRGLLYYKMGKMDLAVADWKKTLEINPGHSNALYDLAAFYFEQKNFSEASFYAKEILKRGLPLQAELQKLLLPINFLSIPQK
jgi:protein O-mannosyl-transferase